MVSELKVVAFRHKLDGIDLLVSLCALFWKFCLARPLIHGGFLELEFITHFKVEFNLRIL